MSNNDNGQIVDKVFRSPDVKYGLSEFSDIKIPDVLEIYEKEKGKFYLKDILSGKDHSMWDEGKRKGRPEEIIRQLWVHKLIKHYGYPADRIQIEKDVQFGREVRAKAVDIVVYMPDKTTPLIVIEVKSPSEKKGLEQLRGYLNAEGSLIGVWSNGIEKAILYRPYPREFQTLRDIPKVGQDPEDVLAEKLTLEKLERDYDLVERLKILEELVLANAGVDVFNEIFKLIYAKLYDEKEAKSRKEHELLFRQHRDSQKTYDAVSRLFQGAIKEWPGIFNDYEKIELTPNHLNIVVGQFEGIKLLDADLDIIDSAFEYLLPDIAKGKKGQYFTPRNVIDMAVKMLNPKAEEYVIDPATGSGGFLIHAMTHVKSGFGDNTSIAEEKTREYAKRYLYGVDFDDKSVKIARALMLIAGDGRSHIFKLNSLNSKEWQGEESEKLSARRELKERLYKFGDYDKDKDNEENFRHFNFDVLLTNPPFAGEIRDSQLLRNYELAKNEKGKMRDKMERHILFIERAFNMIKPGGRLAIVLPQGVLNNTNMEYVRKWIMEKARILAIVGIHVNTFKPHTGTKTSVLFLQKWGEKEKPPKDYPIFMAVSKKSGKDNSGDYVYEKNPDGSYKYSSKGRRILDHDLDEIAEAFVKFAKEQKFSFV